MPHEIHLIDVTTEQNLGVRVSDASPEVLIEMSSVLAADRDIRTLWLTHADALTLARFLLVELELP